DGSVLLRSPNLGEVTIDSPAKAVELGIAYVPEDRRRHGAILEMPIAANMTLAILDRISNLKFLDLKSERKVAVDFATRLSGKNPPTHSLRRARFRAAISKKWPWRDGSRQNRES